MKNISLLLSLLLLVGAYSYGQNNPSGKMQATVQKTFSYDKDGTKFPYNVKVMQTNNYSMDWEKEDEGKIDKDRVSTPTLVTKMIAVDPDNDNEYEHFMVIKYEASVAKNLEVIPNEKGFDVKVDDHIFKYNLNNERYIIDQDDQNFFTIEEFKEIG